MTDVQRLYPHICLPEEYWKCKLSEIPDDLEVPYKEVVVDWVENFKDKIHGRGLHLYGVYGQGKGGVAAIILKAGLFNGYAGLWLNFPLLQKYSIDEDKFMFNANTSMLQRAYETDLLFVDEITIDDNMHWPLRVLEGLIRSRHQNKQTTIIASNSSPADFAKKPLVKGLSSILSEATDSLKIEGKNFRARKNNK